MESNETLSDYELTLKEINNLLPDTTKDIFFHKSVIKELIFEIKKGIRNFNNDRTSGDMLDCSENDIENLIDNLLGKKFLEYGGSE